ncbi:D-Ala-D-Ala carboxypeptidase family metallohydrolase [Halobacteriovorax marinus]|uniref:D-Ala-D-Ala carboxypeptidase family metallohydrolase n=1 Tax=Halobacteriovorax marinus TaxID=97084 RepID=UPI003A8E1C63
MKYLFSIFVLLLVSCSFSFKNRELDWEEIARMNGHHYDDDTHHEIRTSSRWPSATKESKEIDKCLDQTDEELENLDEMILRFDGKINSPDDYEHSMAGLQRFIEDSGLTRYFSAKEMVSPNNSAVAKGCGYEKLLPSRCRWKSAVAQGLLAVELRSEINRGKKTSSGIKIRNWWRPSCYNSKVGGAKSSDHMQARGFDLDFNTPKQRAVAQAYLCKMYKEGKPLSLQVGIGCQTLHIGVGSPKRLSNYPKDGSRFWKYGSLSRCSIKRVSEDDCWKQGRDGKLYIHTEDGGSGVL